MQRGLVSIGELGVTVIAFEGEGEGKRREGLTVDEQLETGHGSHVIEE